MDIAKELEQLKKDIEKHNPDTAWCGHSETVVDRIDWILGELRDAAEHCVHQPSAIELLRLLDDLDAIDFEQLDAVTVLEVTAVLSTADGR